MEKVVTQTDYLEFSNKGEVPINAFKLLGASSKRDTAGKIGYFGTGLKYAMAVMLRGDVEFKIYSGEKEVKIGKRKTKFLDQDIHVITVNGEKTSITMDAGIDWEPWFAVREIYANNLDEQGKMSLASEIKPELGYTKIYIKRDEKLQGLIDNWSSYFSNTRTVLSHLEDRFAVLEKNNHQNFTVFRRGIQAYTNRTPSLFDYDVDNLAINESRVAINDYSARQRAAEALALSDNTGVILRLVSGSDDVIERDSNFWTYLFDDFGTTGLGFSDTWLTVLQDKRIVPSESAGFYGMTSNSVTLPEKLCKHLYKKFGDKLQICGNSKEVYLITDKSNEFMEDSMKELEKVGFGVDMSLVKIARFKDDDILGQSDKGQILISEKLDTPAYINDKLETLFEEIAHHKSGQSDNTRGFQDYIIKITCSLIKHSPEVKKVLE